MDLVMLPSEHRWLVSWGHDIPIFPSSVRIARCDIVRRVPNRAISYFMLFRADRMPRLLTGRRIGICERVSKCARRRLYRPGRPAAPRSRKSDRTRERQC
jgi:hypothetical protein